MPCHILDLTLEVILEFTLEVILELTLEVFLEHVLGRADVAEWLDQRFK